MEHSAFPSDETLAAFIDGRLDEETRKRVVAHVADCEDCYGTVMAAGAWRDAEGLTNPTVQSFPRRFVRPSMGVAAAAAVLALLLFQPVTVRYRQLRDANSLREAANISLIRTVDGRLSLATDYKPRVRTDRGGPKSSENGKGHWRLQEAEARAREDAEHHPTVRALQTAGLGHLLDGDYPNALRMLESALERETSTTTVTDGIDRCNDVELLNDLAAAYDTVANRRADPVRGTLSVLAVQRAWKLDRSETTAWNRAVIMEKQRKGMAASAWKDYLALDSSSEWAQEARLRSAQASAAP